MTNTNLIERLRHQAIDEHEWYGAVAPEHSMEYEAAALIEQQEAVIAGLVEELENIAFNGISRENRDSFIASAKKYVDDGGLYPNERTKAVLVLLAAKNYMSGK